MMINCFWVSGKFVKQGHAKTLLNQCLSDAKAKGYKGVAVIVGDKKKPFLADGSFLKSQGFQVVDVATPYFELLAYTFEPVTDLPRFTEEAKAAMINKPHMVLYFTNQCPHSEKYAHLLETWATQLGISIELNHITSLEQAQNHPAAITNYALFYKGAFVTNEILSEKKFMTLFKK